MQTAAASRLGVTVGSAAGGLLFNVAALPGASFVLTRPPLEPLRETGISSMGILAPELKVTQVGLPMFLAWEFLQSPFYTDTFTESWTGVLYNRVHCAGGDMIILLGAFWLVGLFRGRSWIELGAVAPRVLFIVSGTLYTIFSEYRNVYITHTWAYSGWMPTIGGIGLVPVIQWLIVPTVLLYVIRNSAFKRKASYGH